MKEIKNHVHKFIIENEKIELTINCNNGYWTSKISNGYTGTGDCSGGAYKDLKAYIESQEHQHMYSYNFFKHGHKYAKLLSIK